MSKKTHQKELARARAKRRSSLEAKQRRTKVIAVTVILAMALSLFAVALFSRGDPGGGATDDGAAFDPDDAGATDEPVDPAEASYANPQPVDAEPCPPGSASDVREPDATPRDAPPELTIDEDATYEVTLATTCGEIVLELDASVAPLAVNNFVTLARDGYYDGVPFHRVINGFMIQGGDPTGTGTGCLNEDCSEWLPGYTFEDELEHATALVEEHGGYPRGTVAMANAGSDRNRAQFFIVQGQPGYPLPPQYTAFGSVVDGMEVVDRIAQGPVEEQLAVDPVRIVSVDVSES